MIPEGEPVWRALQKAGKLTSAKQSRRLVALLLITDIANYAHILRRTTTAIRCPLSARLYSRDGNGRPLQ